MSQRNTTLTSPELTVAQFRKIRETLYKECGIVLQAGKETLVKSRLLSRVSTLGLPGFDEYLQLLKSSPDSELPIMVDALTTHKTSFFREPKHFDSLRQVVIRALRESNDGAAIWSAGCSSGQEPYSLAMLFHSELGKSHSRRVRILATDVSANVIETAREGIYSEEAVRNIPRSLLQTYFECMQTSLTRMYRARPILKQMVRFARLNLMRPWPMTGTFDVIFCRNVMMYFDKAAKEDIVMRLIERLRPGGHLFVGHSESISTVRCELNYVQPAVYVKEGPITARSTSMQQLVV